MNKPRRKELQAIYDLISEAKERLEAVRDEEEEYKDNMPENLQCSEKYERAEEIVDNLDEAIDELDTILETIEEATE